MNQPNRSRRLKVVLLLSLICLSVFALMIEGVAYQRQRLQVAPPPLPKPIPTPTPTIVQRLKEINSQVQPARFPYMNARRADLWKAKLERQGDQMSPNTYVSTKLAYAGELLNAGKTDAAVEAIRSLEHEIQVHAPHAWKRNGAYLLILEAVGHLRQGEQQNCCALNNSRSCLLPISGAGIHTKQEGSRGAIRCLTAALKLSPDDTGARWLLNIAYMTVGEYPQNVPTRWLIPLKNYGGDFPMKKFTNVAPQMGLDLSGWAGSVTMDDFEGNGLLDIVVSSFRIDAQLRYFHNNGDGTFSERTEQSGLIGEVGGLNMITTDFNNDGRPDIIVLRGGWLDKNGHYPLSLLRNDGNGHFTDVTVQAGLLTEGPTQTAVAFDYNGDGFLDLFVPYESTNGDPVPCKLFRNNGDGTFHHPGEVPPWPESCLRIMQGMVCLTSIEADRLHAHNGIVRLRNRLLDLANHQPLRHGWIDNNCFHRCSLVIGISPPP